MGQEGGGIPVSVLTIAIAIAGGGLLCAVCVVKRRRKRALEHAVTPLPAAQIEPPSKGAVAKKGSRAQQVRKGGDGADDAMVDGGGADGTDSAGTARTRSPGEVLADDLLSEAFGADEGADEAIDQELTSIARNERAGRTCQSGTRTEATQGPACGIQGPACGIDPACGIEESTGAEGVLSQQPVVACQLAPRGEVTSLASLARGSLSQRDAIRADSNGGDVRTPGQVV